jgi:hypothetical protein
MNIRATGYWLILLAFIYGLLELWAAIGLRLLESIRDAEHSPFPPALLETRYKKPLQKLIEGQTQYVIHSPELGWTIKPNGHGRHESANSQGIRADRDYSRLPPPGKIRLAAFGDSFTHSSNVANAQTWEEVLGGQDPRLEVLNFGVGGYGLDQALLRYLKDGRPFRADIVFIGYMSDDLGRHINTFRPFAQRLTSLPLAKPRFILDGDKLVLVPNPLPDVEQYRQLLENPQAMLQRLGEHDSYYQHAYRAGPLDFLPSVRFGKELVQSFRYPDDALQQGGEYNVNSEAYRVTEKIFDEFVKAALAAGSLPVIIIFPKRSDLRDYRRDGGREYAPLLRHFDRKGYMYIDALHAFDGEHEELELEEIFSGHYTPLGNKLVGLYIHQVLNSRYLLQKASRQKEAEKLRIHLKQSK